MHAPLISPTPLHLVRCAQVVHCRRILKWTYSTAYYAFEEVPGASAAAKQHMAQLQEFFEFNQVRWRGGVAHTGMLPLRMMSWQVV